MGKDSNMKHIPLVFGLGRPSKRKSGESVKEETKTSSVIFVLDNYERVRRLAYVEGRTFKDMINILLKEAIANHHINPREN